MKAWHFLRTGQPLTPVDIPVPVAGPGQVLLQVGGCGLCHTDVGVMEDEGWLSTLVKLPIVMGHEVAGTIIALGPEVADWRIGDRVGVCPSMAVGAPGFSYDGGFAECMLAVADTLVPIPDSVSFAAGAVATDAGMTSHHAMVTSGGLQSGLKVGVIGYGGLGQIGARIAVLMGADVFLAEIDESVWNLAREQGVKEVSNSVLDFVKEDLDLIVDFAGFGVTTAEAIEAVRVGGTVVQVGMGKLEATISTKAMILKRVTLKGSNGGDKHDIESIYSMMAVGDLVPAISEIPLDRLDEGLAQLARGEVTGRLVANPSR